MKIWVDDIRKPPEGYVWCKSVNETKAVIEGSIEDDGTSITILDLDHDAGDFYADGGDYINILNYIEDLVMADIMEVDFPIHIHSMNPVGIGHMRDIIQHNEWVEV